MITKAGILINSLLGVVPQPTEVNFKLDVMIAFYRMFNNDLDKDKRSSHGSPFHHIHHTTT